MALLNLPPLAEFEKFLPSRFRGTGVGASTFIQAGFVFGSTRLRLAESALIPRLESSGFAAGASCWVWEQVVGFGSKLLGLGGWRFVGADIVLFRMNRVSRPSST